MYVYMKYCIYVYNIYTYIIIPVLLTELSQPQLTNVLMLPLATGQIPGPQKEISKKDVRNTGHPPRSAITLLMHPGNRRRRWDRLGVELSGQ